MAMSNSTNASLGSVTGRDEFIIGEALATALIALEQLNRHLTSHCPDATLGTP
jgi:hypothetical protein